MPKRYIRKRKYLRGSRTHGRGNVKNRRGSGNRGGKGNAGLSKHRFTYTVVYKKDHFGRHGFVSIKKKKMPTINIWEIDNLIKHNLLDKEGDMLIFNFKGKILGSGFLSKPVIVRALSFTNKAKEKIESVGGKAEVLG